MADNFDSAVAAVLQIPPEALKAIDLADKKIRDLAKTSLDVSNSVRTHWGKIATDGLQTFIDKIGSVQNALNGLSNKPIEFNINTTQSQQNLDALSNQTKKTGQDISQMAQDIASQMQKIMSASFSEEMPIVQLKELRNAIKGVRDSLSKSEPGGSGLQGGAFFSRQELTDQIKQIEAIIALIEKSTAEKDKAARKEADDENLRKQKDQLQQIKDLQKKINDETARQASEQKLGRTVPQGEIDQLRQWWQDLIKVTQEYEKLKESKDKMSEVGKAKFEAAEAKTMLAVTAEQINAQEKYNATLKKTSKLMDDSKLRAAGMSTTETGQYQANLVNNYQAIIDKIKERGNVEAQVARQGETATQEQKNLIQALNDEIERLEKRLRKLTGTFAEIDRVQKESFENQKRLQEARNEAKISAAKLKYAEQQEKIEQANIKKVDEEIAARRKLVETAQKQWEKEQELARQKSGKEYVASIERELQKRDAINDNLTKRINLQQQIIALENKQALAQAKDPNAKLSFTDETNLQKYKQGLVGLNNELHKLTLNYPELKLQADQAFDVARVNMEILAQKRLSDAIKNVIDANQKAQDAKTKKNEDIAENDLNRLYSDRLWLLKQIEQLNNREKINKAKGLTGLTGDENNLLADLKARLDDCKAQIVNIANLYPKLATEAKKAFDSEDLRQTVELSKQLNSALSSIKTSQISKDVAEYKKLHSELQKINKSIDDWNNKIQGKKLFSAPADIAKANQALNELLIRRGDVEQKMFDLESKNITAINNFRVQKDSEANQQSVSAFIQAESEKTAIARQKAEEQAQMMIDAQRRSYAYAMASYNQLMTGGGRNTKTPLKDTYADREAVIKRLEAAIKNLDKADSDYEAKLNQLTSALNKLKDAQKDVNDVLKRQTTPTLASAQQLVQTAKATKSLQDYKRAYDELKAVMSKMDSSSTDFTKANKDLQEMKKHIDDIKKAMGEFSGRTRDATNLMNQLGNRIKAAFAVGAITGYIKKMVETRAQFELQRVALGAIIQDTDEANKTFLKIQQMALESPFTIMQLERATKQIAAFGFETQKLLPTMKMFADISAGLGVEIDRLVLVMGHLKARNFLEGTMVRQFTNMGFNILGELAKYYSEIEDKMISVGEVQDRVKKKMVSFEDVEEVLKRVTSAGGMFYEMQRKQAESVHGQIQRIKDAMDLMMNDIGKSNQNLITGALAMLRSLIQNWRTVWNAIKLVGSATAGYILTTKLLRSMGVSSLKEIGTWWKLLVGNIRTATAGVRANTIAMRALSAAWKGLISSTGVGVIIAGLSMLAAHLWLATDAADALNEELGRISDESVRNVNESIATFKLLADTVSDSSKTYNDREEAMKELVRVYSDILPKEKLEWDYIVGLKGDYKELTKAITEYYSAKEYQNKTETILGGDDAKQLQKEVEKFYLERNKEGVFGMMFPESVLKAKAEAVAKEIATGKIANSVDAIGKRIAETLSLENADFSKWYGESYGEIDLHDITQTADRITKSLGEITIAAAMAENATMDLSEAFAKMDSNQLKRSREELESRKTQLEQAIVNAQQKRETDQVYGTSQKSIDDINKYNAELAVTIQSLEMLEQAQAKLVAQEFAKEVENEIKVLTDVGRKYASNAQAMRSLEMQGRTNEKAYKDLVKANKRIAESNDELKKQFGTELPLAQLETCETTYDVNKALDKVAKEAYPTVAKKAIESMAKTNKAILEAEKSLFTFLQNIGTALKKYLPEDMTDWIPDLSSYIQEADKKLAAVNGQLGNTAEKAEDAAESIESIYSSRAKSIAKDTGADIKKIDDIISKNMNAADTAKKLRQEAKKTQEDIDSYINSTNKSVWLSTHDKTEAEMEQMKKNVKGMNQLADELDGQKEKGKGKDLILELWKNRLKAVEDFYKRYEELRKHYDSEESLIRDKDAFTDLFKTLGLDMDSLISEGMDKQGLANNLKKMVEQVRLVRPQLVDEFQKAFADTQIQVDFKIKEGEEDRLKRQLDEMFDNYQLTKELKDIGLNVDLTYMVGGKPTTLQDIRDEIARLREEGGGTEDAENRIKILEDAEKKITDMEVKEQRTRLKNYEKYLKTMYSERAKTMIESYTTMYQMEEDFQKNIAQLEAEMNAEGTSEARKKELAELIEILQQQAKEGAEGVKRELENALDKIDWNQFKGSPLFTEMFQDLDTLGQRGLDALIKKLEDMRDKLQSMDNVDYKAVREITQNIEKLNQAKIDIQPYTELRKAMKEVNALKKQGIDYDQAQINLINAQNQLDSSEREMSDLETIIRLKNDGKDLDRESKILTDEQVSLYQDYKSDLNGALAKAKEKVKADKAAVEAAEKNVDAYRKAKMAIEAQIKRLQQLKESVTQIVNACFEIADAVGGVVDDEWKNLVSTIVDATFQAIILTFQFKLMGIALNSSMGIIGYIAIALQVVASLLSAIFAAHDKKLQKQIEKLQDEVDALDKAFQKLQKSIEKAFTLSSENKLTQQAIDNLNKQKEAYEDMIRLEEAKKKTDNDQIKEYKEKIEDLDDALEELYETRHEKWGSTNDVWGEANNWVDAWLDAFNETGDGLDSLNESWDEFYENLVKKQAVSKVLGTRMNKWIEDINKIIDSNMGEYGMVDAFKELGAQIKAEFGNANELLKQFFEYAGIGGNGEYLLSDLQKGIQNITEPQAAAIEAYLNSMRFAVFRHTEQLDILITTIQAQYGVGESPMLQEVRAIRSMVSDIRDYLGKVIVNKNAVNNNYALKVV